MVAKTSDDFVFDPVNNQAQPMTQALGYFSQDLDSSCNSQRNHRLPNVRFHAMGF
jgi:hypothetical protein